MSVPANIQRVRERIADSAARSGRAPEDVRLVVVSKTWPATVIERAIDAGVTDLGENRAQELAEKAAQISGVRWHFVGHLQSNKVRHVVGVAALVHSVDSVSLAQTIAKRALAQGLEQEILLEVNVSGEEAKQGVPPADLARVAEEIAPLEGVSLRGLMTIPPLPETAEHSRPYLRRLAELGAELRHLVPSASELSMGMTRDLEIAVEEGATIVRVGEAIFGPRSPA